MRQTCAQGATQPACEPAYCPLQGQGATEYLVLLAVVLIVALVSVALLGFFPGMASDAQITQSQMYWHSASPIAVSDVAARYISAVGYTTPYLRLKNTGIYPIRITRLLGGNETLSQFYGYTSAACGIPGNGYYNISDYFYLAPDEEQYFNYGTGYVAGACSRLVALRGGTTAAYVLGGASSSCQNSSASPGVLDYGSFGFEYVEYIEGQQVTKRLIGKDFIVKCLPPV